MDEQTSCRLAGQLVSLAPAFRRAVLVPLDRCPECELTPCELQALLCVLDEPWLNMTALAGRLGVSRQQLTRTVDALARRGLVERRSPPGNRRTVQLFAGEAAQALRASVTKTLADSLAPALAALCDSEKRALAAFCRELAAQLAPGADQGTDKGDVLA